MTKILAFLALSLGLVAPAAAGNYSGSSISTTTGQITTYLGGTFEVAASSVSISSTNPLGASTFTVILNGNGIVISSANTNNKYFGPVGNAYIWVSTGNAVFWDQSHPPCVIYSSGSMVCPNVSASAGGVPPSGPAGGDLTGTYPNPTLVTNNTDLQRLQAFTQYDAALTGVSSMTILATGNAIYSLALSSGANVQAGTLLSAAQIQGTASGNNMYSILLSSGGSFGGPIAAAGEIYANKAGADIFSIYAASGVNVGSNGTMLSAGQLIATKSGNNVYSIITTSGVLDQSVLNVTGEIYANQTGNDTYSIYAATGVIGTNSAGIFLWNGPAMFLKTGNDNYSFYSSSGGLFAAGTVQAPQFIQTNTPGLCTAGSYARGVDGNLNATGCTASGAGLSDGASLNNGLFWQKNSTLSVSGLAVAFVPVLVSSGDCSGTSDNCFDVQVVLPVATSTTYHLYLAAISTQTNNTDFLAVYFTTGQSQVGAYSAGNQSNTYYQWGVRPFDNTGGVAGGGSNASRCVGVAGSSLGAKQGRPVGTEFVFGTEATSSTTIRFHYHSDWDNTDASVGEGWTDGGGHAGPFGTIMTKVGFGWSRTGTCDNAASPEELSPMDGLHWELWEWGPPHK